MRLIFITISYFLIECTVAKSTINVASSSIVLPNTFQYSLPLLTHKDVRNSGGGQGGANLTALLNGEGDITGHTVSQYLTTVPGYEEIGSILQNLDQTPQSQTPPAHSNPTTLISNSPTNNLMAALTQTNISSPNPPLSTFFQQLVHTNFSSGNPTVNNFLQTQANVSSAHSNSSSTLIGNIFTAVGTPTVDAVVPQIGNFYEELAQTNFGGGSGSGATPITNFLHIVGQFSGATTTTTTTTKPTTIPSTIPPASNNSTTRRPPRPGNNSSAIFRPGSGSARPIRPLSSGGGGGSGLRPNGNGMNGSGVQNGGGGVRPVRPNGNGARPSQFINGNGGSNGGSRPIPSGGGILSMIGHSGSGARPSRPNGTGV